MEIPSRWWTRRGSNPRPRRCERRALPTELLARKLSCLFNILVQHGSRIYQANNSAVRPKGKSMWFTTFRESGIMTPADKRCS